MNIKNVGKRFFETYRKEDGGFFKGLVGKPPMTGRYTNYSVGGMVLFTGLYSGVEVGDVFTSRTGRVMMVMDNAEIETGDNLQKCFVIKIMNKNVTWTRQVKEKDPITGLDKTTNIKNMGNFWCSFESAGNRTDVTHITLGKYRFICNKELREGDTLDNKYRITKVDHLVGVTIADADKA